MRLIINIMKKIALIISSILIFGIAAFAQSNLEVYKADLSVPFGEADGKVIAVGEQIVFVDDDKPEFSFAIAKNNISDVKSKDKVLTIETKQAVADRSGMKSRFVMRVEDDGAEKLEKWLKSGSGFIADTKSNNQVTVISNNSPMIYEAEHKHRLYGSCTGKLIIGEDRISYESADDRDHSRQWLFTDIKKIKRKSPYKFEVQLFKGDGYGLEILGQGIDITDFKKVENKLAIVKAAR